MTEPKLLTEAEAQGAWSATYHEHADSFLEYKAKLRERGLIAPEPVDPLLLEARELVIQDGTIRTVNQIEAIRDGRAGKGKVALAFAALKRGMELGRAERPELTREMVSRACGIIFANGGKWLGGDIDALHAALLKQMQP
jgi:hypothetical protein